MTREGAPSEPLSLRGTEVCRGCGAQGLVSVLDLGSQPLANELAPSPETVDELFPLHLRICPLCGLGQVGEYATRERIFRDYRYLSSVSASWLAHGERYVETMQREFALDAGSLVLEVASNDGYLLREFLKRGIPVLGIEPAENVASIARAQGIETLSEFFGVATAEQILQRHGHPRLIVANNVMAHVPDLDDFVGGLAVLCDERSVVTIENPSFTTLLGEVQFDTIYHEHFSYLSAHAVRALVRRHGLELVRVESIPTHGGSYRYWVRRPRFGDESGSVDEAIDCELSLGLLDPRLWSTFARRSAQTIGGLSDWMTAAVNGGRKVVAYGAAAKGNTLLNAARVTVDQLPVVADASPEKQGWYLPLSHVPVVAPNTLTDMHPTDVLVLPWNIAAELVPIVSRLCPASRVWVAVPEMVELKA